MRQRCHVRFDIKGLKALVATTREAQEQYDLSLSQ